MSLSVSARESLNFLSKPLAAGKAALTENSFYLDRVLGIANFSPDLRLPVQLFYKSTSESTGMFGFGWSSPQLESSAKPEKDGVLWKTPWGEQIRFYEKEKPTKEMLELYREGMKGRGDYYSPGTPDTCGGSTGFNDWWDDDVCYNGTNNNSGQNGGDDNCGIFASDQCNDGSTAQDSCKEIDICPGGSAELDVCNEQSSDYCDIQVTGSDSCVPPNDTDECLKHVDTCSSTNSSADGCTTGRSFDDACEPSSVDNCSPLIAGSDVPE